MKRKPIIAIVLILLISVVAVYAVLQQSKTLHTNVIIQYPPPPPPPLTLSLEIYSDASATSILSSVDWGTLNPSGSSTRTIYLKNTGTTNFVVSQSTQNWSPNGSEIYFTFTWNYSGSTITPNLIIPIALTLTVSASVTTITNFGFDIVITATQA